MSNKVEQTPCTNGFQTFEPFENNENVLVSKQLLDELKIIKEGNTPKKLVVQKYLSIDNLIKSIIGRYFYLSAPSEWDDPFEMKYLDSLKDPIMERLQNNEDRVKLNNMSIFCSCLTFNVSDNEEASWKSYSSKRDEVIRVTYDFTELCKNLDNPDNTIYVGKVDYKSRKEILTPQKENYNYRQNKHDNLETLYVNNFCFKQNAYQYEHELRFCTILNGEQYKEWKSIKIEGINLLSSILKITLPPINYKTLSAEEQEIMHFNKIKKYLVLKTLFPDVPIHESNLYNKDKLEMTTEFHF